MSLSRPLFLSYMRNFIFGTEDSFVSTVGLLAGVTASGAVREEIMVAGFVLISVEAFSMGVGSYLSERSLSDTETKKEKRETLVGGAIMFLSYILAGLVPLIPYLVLPIELAFYVSIAATLVSLFLLGVISARILKIHVFKNAFRMLFLGGTASLLGIAVGVAIS